MRQNPARTSQCWGMMPVSLLACWQGMEWDSAGEVGGCGGWRSHPPSHQDPYGGGAACRSCHLRPLPWPALNATGDSASQEFVQHQGILIGQESSSSITIYNKFGLYALKYFGLSICMTHRLSCACSACSFPLRQSPGEFLQHVVCLECAQKCEGKIPLSLFWFLSLNGFRE